MAGDTKTSRCPSVENKLARLLGGNGLAGQRNLAARAKGLSKYSNHQSTTFRIAWGVYSRCCHTR